MIDSSILRWEDYPDNYQERSSVTTSEARGSGSEDVLTEAEIRVMWLGAKECRQPLETGKGKD